MTKQFEYNGYRFTITVDINVEAERRLNGTQRSKITIGTDFGKRPLCYSKVVDNQYIVSVVHELKDMAKKHVDAEPEITAIEKQLLELGFK